MDNVKLADGLLKLFSKFVMWLVERYQKNADVSSEKLAKWRDYYAKRRNDRIDRASMRRSVDELVQRESEAKGSASGNGVEADPK